ncbi:RNA polymerase-associated protein RapA [bacterium]|nr:RNA polymerase-associated protein RapA [bacterium]
MPLQIGQRVVCEAELGLGLGEIVAIGHGGIADIRFAAVGQNRRYRLDTAPLRRVVLHVGQLANCQDGSSLRVESLREEDGLLYYQGQGKEICEKDLESRLPLASPVDRLRAQNLGVSDELELHIAAWKVRTAMLGGNIRGLCGSRVGLLDHQLYVAHRVSRLAFPRVLLADQVGLGKTIEAGMIFSALRSLGRADRVLIVVPDSLVHQWLAEMVRRFNELFRLIGQEAADDDEPFHLNSRCLTTWGALKCGLFREACSCDWDLVIIDEAHHLRDGQFAHMVASMLAKRTHGLLLLTGTPARNGAQSEFTLLNLVDAKRYNDFAAYSAQRTELHRVSEVAKALHEAGENYDGDAHDELLDQLKSLFPHDEGLSAIISRFRSGDAIAYGELIDALIDRHGPGRVIFRNRRERLQKLFPGRHVELVPLHVRKNNVDKVVDPRLQWIVSFLKKHPQEKLVVISSKAEVVVALQKQLRQNWNIDSAVFYESLPLVERDRQAVWFSAADGAQVLLCSEIGSEGRNFQFAHNLAFWDVPIPPDIVEQRIGRLDRLGQRHVVNVYVLYLQDTAVEYLLRWHMAMGSFDGPVENASEIIARVHLRDCLNEEDFPAMLAESQRLLCRYKEQARENIDYLVDLNSYNEKLGADLHREVLEAEKVCDLPVFITRLLEVFGVTFSETRRPGVFVLQADLMRHLDQLVGWRPDMVATFDRGLAVMYEDVEYLTPDHPLVLSAISALLDGASGCASALRWQGAAAPGLLMQCLYVFEAAGPQALELYRYMPPITEMITVDVNGNPFEGSLPDTRTMREMNADLLGMLLSKLSSRLDRLAEVAAKLAMDRLEERRREYQETAERQLQEEYVRLLELQRVNCMVSQAEVDQFAAKKSAVLQALQQAKLRLDGVRLVLMESH